MQVYLDNATKKILSLNEGDVLMNSSKDTNHLYKQGSECPTDRELEAYYIIINTLRKTMPINDISYKRNDEYIALIYKNDPNRCICRLYLNEPQNYIVIPLYGSGEKRIDIKNIYDLTRRKILLTRSLMRVINQ